MLTRRTFAIAATLGLVTTVVPRVQGQVKLEKTKISLAVGGKEALYYLPLTLTEQLGYFKAEGLEVEINDLAGSPRALQSLVSGTADVCSCAFEHTITQQVRNRFFQAFVLQGRAPQIALGVSTRHMVGYRSVADLRGKRIGVSVLGSSTHMVANLVLSRGGLKPGDVSFVDIGAAAGALHALRSGEVDAISNTDPVMTMLEQKGDIKIISDTRTLKGMQEVFGGTMPAACLMASAEFVQKHPATCQALTNAVVRCLKWLQTAGPADILKTVPETYLLGDRALYLAAFDNVRESIATDGLVPVDGPATALAALAMFDGSLKADRIDLAKTYTNQFAQRAKDRFRA